MKYWWLAVAVAAAAYWLWPKSQAKILKIGRVKIPVETAVTSLEKARGLSGRSQLPEGSGMLFVFEEPGRHGFWMNGMKFPLDFIWISGDRVVGTTETAPVTQMDIKPPQSIDRVLEVNSGFVARNKIKIGDKVSYEPVSN